MDRISTNPIKQNYRQIFSLRSMIKKEIARKLSCLLFITKF